MSSFSSDPFIFQPESYTFPEEFNADFHLKLRQYLSDIAIALNVKENAFFIEDEIPTGGLFIPIFDDTKAQSSEYRPVYRKVVDCGALPNTGVKSVAHGITIDQNFSLIHMYGGATDPTATSITNAIPIPFASQVGAQAVAVEMDNTNVIITTGSDRTAYTRTFITIEYIKET